MPHLFTAVNHISVPTKFPDCILVLIPHPQNNYTSVNYFSVNRMFQHVTIKMVFMFNITSVTILCHLHHKG